MHKAPNLSGSLLLPAGLLSLLVGGSALVPPPIPPRDPGIAATQRKPSSVNPHQILILHADYRFYLRAKQHHWPVQEAVDGYNYCVDDSDATLLRGSGLPVHLTAQY